ncbi:exocyst complex component EXO70A1 [Selaginella moellendorffii]|uniref:exocyst complex component EXO70A1 n=1 Tax=Selaginella moellendorffii TaxID=88036 RepID=UPI000D1C33BE|nr:exocyst complex component EXO70A1 [Selaginella moellendorffii]|eukprot:XP_024533986.1 exocyst complex component EXO70A1 [Selaginella moellendorffii]
MAALDGEERVLATAQHIVRSLGTTDATTDDMIEILSKFDNRFHELLSKKTIASASSTSVLPDGFADSLDAAEEVIMRWDKASSDAAWTKMIWDSNDDAVDYLHAVDEVQNILESLSLSQRRAGVERAQNLLHVSMARLEDEFRCLLETTSGPVDPERLLDSFASSSMAAAASSSFNSNCDDDGEGSSIAGTYRDEEGENSSDDDNDEDVPVARPVTDLNPVIELLPPDVVESLNDIAKRLVQGHCKLECCQIYGSVRKVVLEESLQRLGMDRLGIDETQRMPWELLQNKIKKWIQVMDVGVKVLFASERQLCDQVLEGIPGGVEESCFAELAKGIMMQLLCFGEAVAIGKRETDKLITILDMYEKLRDLLPEIHSIFSGESCLSVREEASGVLLRLGEAAKGTFAEFENAVQRDPPKTPVPRGALHPLTRFVMNYLRFLLVYVDTLKKLFGEKPAVPVVPGDEFARGGGGYYGSSDEYYHHHHQYSSVPAENTSPLAVQFIWIIHLLEANLDNKSKLYKDLALTNLFLMNNVRYIVQKVRHSELSSLLGDDWMRRHSAQVRQHAKSYERSAWVKVLACLKDEGIRSGGSFSTGVSKAVLKERFKSFNSALEEIHRTQSGWCVPDSQLRSELRISVAEKLIQGYRAFLGRYKIYLESERNPQKYIKYTPEELEKMVNDLFGGS